MKTRFFGFLYVAVLIGLDQLSKLWAMDTLKGTAGLTVIENVFELRYVENTGSAFGLFAGKVHIFAVITVILSLVLIFLYFKIPVDTDFKVYRVLLLTLIAGGVGNVIDRLMRGFVVDFFYFKPINFPVFNVADCYVSLSVFIFLLYFLIRKDDRLGDLFFKQKEEENRN